MPIRTQLLKCGWVRTQKNTWDLRPCQHVYTQSHQCTAVAVDVRQTGSPCRCLSTVVVAHTDVNSHSVHTALVSCHQWRRQGEGGKLPPYGWTSKNYVICVCFRCHGTPSYHTTNTLQGRRAKSDVDTQTIQPGLGDFVL